VGKKNDMKKKINDFLAFDEGAGILEWLFAATAVLSALPSVAAYFFIRLLIIAPTKALVKKVWK